MTLNRIWLVSPWATIGNSRRKMRAFVHVFTDDSDSFGKEGFMCLAGCIASDENWNRFHDEWSDMLGKHKMPRMHTADFLSGHGNYGQLELNYDERVSVLQEFMPIIRRHVQCVVLVGVNATEYRDVFKAHKKRLSPSHFLFLRLLKFCHDQMDEWGYSEPISFVFDDDHKISPKLYASWSFLKRRKRAARNKMAGITFADDGLMAPLQAADVIACGLVRAHRDSEVMWDLKHDFSPLFIEPKGPQMAMQIRQEFWDHKELSSSKTEILRAAMND